MTANAERVAERRMRRAGTLVIGVAVGLAVAVAAASGWRVRDFPERGFSVAVPRGWRVDPGYHDRGYAYYQGNTEDQIAGVRISAPADGFGKGEPPFDRARMTRAMDAIRDTIVVAAPHR